MTKSIQQHYEDLAQYAGKRIATLEGVELITLMGSVAIGIADEHSDIDLLVFYMDEPDIENIRMVLNDEKMSTKADKFWMDSDKFSVPFNLDGVSASVVFMKKEWYELLIAKYPKINLEEYKQLAHCITEATYLAGNKEVYDSWKERIGTLPQELKELALDSRIAPLRNFFIQKRIVTNLQRKDWLFINHLFDQGVEWALEAVFLLNNKVYASSKFAQQKLAQMKIKPAHMVERLEHVAQGRNTEESVLERVDMMAHVTQEIVDLAKH